MTPSSIVSRDIVTQRRAVAHRMASVLNRVTVE
jgi:hypothetical protein